MKNKITSLLLFTRQGLFMLLVLLAMAPPVFGNLVIVTNNVNQPKTYIPQGTVGAAVLRLEILSTDGDSLQSIEIENLSGEVHFGKGVTAVYVYQDVDGDNIFDSDDTPLGNLSFGTNDPLSSQTLNNLSGAIVSGETEAFWIVYDLADDTTLTLEGIATTTNVGIVD
ncbi:MAG: hypothetical protein HRT90_03585, partial [Candidatus Margulisbacteria bacterium]|nr:hypothetical protein [Candidatus Margulisiibacteriota bacterium]